MFHGVKGSLRDVLLIFILVLDHNASFYWLNILILNLNFGPNIREFYHARLLPIHRLLDRQSPPMKHGRLLLTVSLIRFFIGLKDGHLLVLLGSASSLHVK